MQYSEIGLEWLPQSLMLFSESYRDLNIRLKQFLAFAT